jgi:hypothetical protein
MLFVGTDEPLPVKEWRKDAPDICVLPVLENESGIRAHFSKAIVQFVGSTAGCGCDFPHWMLQNGEIPDDPTQYINPEEAVTHDYNRQALVKLLETGAQGSVEIYGVWAGNYAKAPKRTEQISIDRLRDVRFCLASRFSTVLSFRLSANLSRLVLRPLLYCPPSALAGDTTARLLSAKT